MLQCNEPQKHYPKKKKTLDTGGHSLYDSTYMTYPGKQVGTSLVGSSLSGSTSIQARQLSRVRPMNVYIPLLWTLYPWTHQTPSWTQDSSDRLSPRYTTGCWGGGL